MFKTVSLRTKLFTLVTLVVAVSFLAVSILVSRRSVLTAKEDAFRLAEEMAHKYKNEIMAELQGARVTSETLKAVLEILKEHDITNRDMMNDILRKALEQKEYITAFCIAYEKDMLDGKDAQYAGTALYDETGRYAPYWNKLGNNIEAEPLINIDTQDWYTVPKETMKEYITDPYPFRVQGQSVMLASFVFPILHDGGFIGIIASDIVLDKLQEMVSEADARGMGEYTEVFSNSGVVVAHPDDKYLGKTICETVMYNMLLSHPDKSDTALGYINSYIERNPASGLSDQLKAKEHNSMVGFAESLSAYAADPQNSTPDLGLLTPALAQAALASDQESLIYAHEASAAIENGEMYVSSNDDYYTVYMPVRFSVDTKPWSVAVSIPTSEILSGSNSTRDYILIVCAISVLVIAFVIYLISRSATNPLLKLAGAAKELGEGNLNVEVPLIQSSKEIVVLSTAFNVMAERIDVLVKTLKNNTVELEEKNSNLNYLNKMLIATNHVAKAVMNVEQQQFRDVLYRSLQLLGKSAEASVVSIWKNFTYPDGKTYGRRLSAWIAGQSDQYVEAETTIDLDRLLPGWNLPAVAMENSSGAVLDGSAFLFSSEALQHSGSLFFIPLTLHDSCWGFIAFSYSVERHRLQSDASEILRSGGMMIASAIIQNQIAEDLKKAEKKASTDALTGLTNRNGFLLNASGVFSACKDEGLPVTLLFFDLDHFKLVNDKYGHPFGDKVLKAFAEVMVRETKTGDVCCRYGGEEFVLLSSNCADTAGRQIANLLLESVRKIHFPESPEFSFTVSIGMITGVPGKLDTLDGYIQKADEALYKAKNNGRNQVVVFNRYD